MILKKREGTERHIERRMPWEDEAEIGGMHTQAKELQGLQTTIRSEDRGMDAFSLRASKRN